MRLFGWKAARPAARPVLARAWSGLVTPPLGDWPAGYEQQVRDALIVNAIAQRAVRIVAEGAGAVPFYAEDDATPAVSLIRATSAGQALIETAAVHLLLHGNAYIQIVRDAGDMPAMLYALRPERVAIEPGPDGWPAAYLYRAGDRATRLAVTDEAGRPTLVHIKSLHPTDDHYGLGCLGAAAGAVAIHNASSRWNKALLDNAARPSGALVYDAGSEGGTLSPEQFDRLKTEMIESFSGSGNAGRPMLLEGGLKWQAMSMTPADMDFAGLKAAAAREIAMAFGVPPMLLGLPGDATYANYTEANRALWRLTIVPLAGRLIHGIEEGLRAWWPALTLALDLDGLPALAADREALWGQLKDASFLSDDEKREMLGFAPRTPAPAAEPTA